MEREIIEIVAAFIIGAPLLGLSVRLALRPLIDAAVRIGASFETLTSASRNTASARIPQLEEEIHELRIQLERARDGLAFERSLHPPE